MNLIIIKLKYVDLITCYSSSSLFITLAVDFMAPTVFIKLSIYSSYSNKF
jgi:hypothetical protein